MSNGVLGKAVSQSGNNVVVYTAPANVDFATISIACLNTGSVDAIAKVAVGTSNPPAMVDYIEYDAVIPANGGILERTCIVVSPGENVIVNANSNDVVTRVYGLEQEA